MKRLLLWLLPAVLLGVLSAWGRFALVEPAAMIAACESQQGEGCLLRQMIIEVFVHQRVGWVALVCGALATIVRWQWLASVAVATGVVALVLYTPEPGSIALLLGLLVLLRGSLNSRQRRTQDSAIRTAIAEKPSA